MSVEVLKQILENDVLTEDTKSSIKTAFDIMLTEARQIARAEVEQEVTTKLTEEFERDRATLIESIDSAITEALTAQLTEQHAALSAYRDVEVDAAEALVEARTKLTAETKAEVRALIESLDTFLDEAVDREFHDLRDSLVEAQRSNMGMAIYEGFKEVFEGLYVSKTGIATKMGRLANRLEATSYENQQLKESIQQITRDQTLTRVLSPLEGKPRQVMETILSTVSTDRLEETYGRFIDRVLSADGASASSLTEGKRSEKEVQVLAEGQLDPNTVSLKTGDEPETKKRVLTEGSTGLTEEDKRRLLKTAGLI